MSTKKLQIISGLGAKVYAQADEPTDAVDGSVWIDLDEESGSVGSGVDVTAEVGQTILVEEIDESGKPTKWKAVDYQEKICGTELGYIIPETTLNIESGGAGELLVDTMLVEGKTYVVNWEGVDYTCVCLAVAGEGVVMYTIGNIIGVDGETDTGEPFLIGTASMDGVILAAIMPIDESVTAFTFSVKGDVVTPIPVEYVSNAFPYYIEVTATEGETVTTPTTYSTSDTVGNITAIYNSGRDIVARVARRDDTNGYTTYYLYRLVGAMHMDTGEVLFIFTRPFHYAGSAIPQLYFVPQEDGTYAVSDSLSDA